MSLILSPKMASKRPSAADTIFPPKKRALYEHMKHHGIERFSTNEMSANEMIHYQENLGIYGVKVPVNTEISQSENFLRKRSDSLHSHVSSNSDNTETGSSGSRETSPCTIQSLFDHQTPERNPITSLDGLKSDILKPLFPPSDSDSSMVDNEEHQSPDNSVNEKQNRIYIHKYGSEEITQSKEKDSENIPENKHSSTFHGNKARKSDSFKDPLIPNEISYREVKVGENDTLLKQKQSEVYMGPMVSLLNRFNAEAPRTNIGLKMKDHVSLEEMRSIVHSQSSISQDIGINSAPSIPLGSNHVQSQNLTEKDIEVTREKRSCHICNKEFNSRANLHNHMKSHENKSISCWVCKEIFQSADNLNAHMKIEHKGENPYKCEHCSREFTQFNNLRRHMRVHREKVYKCNLCNREFNEEFYLKMHMGTHTGKRVYSCGVCGAGFPSSHDLKMHVKTHSPSLLHTCDVCGKSFSKACVLRQHKKGHSGERPHKCDKCEKTFIHRHHLTMHMKSHVDEKRLSCNICQKEFSQHSHLYKHLRAHEDMKKYGMDLDSTQNMKYNQSDCAKKKEISKCHQNVHTSLKEVVSQENLSSNKSEINDKHLRKRDRVSSGDIQKERKRYISNDSKQQAAGITNVQVSESRSSNGKYRLPSMSQTFSHQMIRHPRMQYSQDVSHSYLPGSPASPFPPLFNPLLGNRVPAPFQGYQSYNHLYRNYTEQMQIYYNKMYMMQYIAQNALLQKGQTEGQTLQYIPDENNTEQKSSDFKIEDTCPKIIEGVEILEDRAQDCQSDSDDNSEVDVVTATNDQDQNNPDYTDNVRNREQENSTMKHGHTVSEEHEIAQELLKMSAGTERTYVDEKDANNAKEDYERKSNEILAKEVDMKEQRSHVKIVNFGHCVNEIIERTIRNSDLVTENMCTLKSPNTKAYSTTSISNVPRSPDNLSVAIPKSVNQSFDAVGLDIQKYEQVEGIACVDSGERSINRNSESQASPLQKLKLFVTSEENDFNKVETTNDSKEILLNRHLTEEISKLESVQFENDPVGYCGGDDSDTGENFVNLISANNEVKKVENGLCEAAVIEDSLEMRLEKIKQFADIGMKFGHSVVGRNVVNEITKKLKEEGSLEDTRRNIMRTENNKDVQLSEVKVLNDGIGSVELKINDSENIFESEVEAKSDATHDMPGYFDDSLEERQLEIVEDDSFRGEGTEKCTDGGNDYESDYGEKYDLEQLSSSEDKEINESKEVLNNSTERYVLTENEFVAHISEINDLSEANKNDEVKVVEDTNGGKVEETDVVSEENRNVYVVMKGCEEKSGMDFRMRNDKIYAHQFRDIAVNRSELESNVKYLTENRTENGAIDLRTEKNINKFNEGEAGVNILQENSSHENLPMDLSMSRRWIDDAGSEKAYIKDEQNIDSNCKSSSPAVLTCGLCKVKFNSIEKLQCHQIQHAKEIGYRCNICMKLFTGAFELQCHMLKHRQSEMSVQNQVSSCINNNLKCIENSVSSFGEQIDCSNKSNEGGEENQENVNAELSERNENGKKGYSCKYCDKTFNHAKQLTDHVAVHNASKKPYVCNICRRAFVHRHNLNRHKMSHNSKSFKCDICHRSFKESFYLQMHMKTHEEENYHKCQICGENVRKSEIWQHTNQHLGHITENPTYKEIGYKVKEILHEQDMNMGGTAQENKARQILPYMTEYGDDLRRTKFNEISSNDEGVNLRKENIENLKLNKTTDTVTKHVNVFQNKENSRNGSLVLPENGYQENFRHSGALQMYECHICKSILRTKHELENHMGIHSGLRPYVCKTCGRAFKKSKGLKTHEKIHLESSFKE